MATPAYIYARAAFEVAQGRKETEKLRDELRAFWDFCSVNNAVRAICTTGVVAPKLRHNIVKDACAALSLGALSSRLLLMLSDRSRLSELPGLISDYERLMDSAAGIEAGTLKSAVELSAEELSVLSSALSKKVNAKVRLSQSVDPGLLGGFVANVGGKTYDASLKSQLDRFKSELV